MNKCMDMLLQFGVKDGLLAQQKFTFIPEVSWLPLEAFAINIFQMPAGAFIVFGIILAVLAFIKNRKAEKKAAIERAEKIRKAEEAKKAAAAAQAQQAVEGGNK